MAKTFAEHYNLEKTQAELDFVDIQLYKDTPLFIDPLPLSQRLDSWSKNCHLNLVSYFDILIQSIRSGDDDKARELLAHLKEPNETRLGYSAGKPKGAGVGKFQSEQIFQALKASTAVKTGFISSLEECELMIDGISHDKISDITTNVLRADLVIYTQQQCLLHGIDMQKVAVPPCFDPNSASWVPKYAEMPVVNGKIVMLVPKSLAQLDPAYDYQKYYRHYALDFLQARYLAAGQKLVRILKDKQGNIKRKVVYKKDVALEHPLSKGFVYDFSRKHKDILDKYRDDARAKASEDRKSDVDPENEKDIADLLIKALKIVPPGSTNATRYHRLMIGVLEFIFYPYLIYPRKEKEINEGRKRIDIVMENGARGGIFERLHSVRHLPCSHVAIECKNYSTDVSNPELDQLAGRFSVNRGQLGILCCRKFEDRKKFIKSCKDTFKDGRGLIFPLDDIAVINLLGRISNGQRDKMDEHFTNLIDEVWHA